MATESRWKQAQQYEQAHWQRIARGIQAKEGEGLSWYQWRADNLLDIVGKAFGQDKPDFTQAHVLEVGSGPVGLVSGLKAARRVALDPLCDFFSTQPELTEHRDPDVEYVCSQGETIPFDSESFDLIVIENVIDHVQNARGVMDEIYRVLKKDHWLYLSVNCHPLWGAFVHEIVSRLRIDKGHPHTFTLGKIRRFLASLGFELNYEDWEDYAKCRTEDFKSDVLRARLKAVSGLSEFLYTSIHRKI